MEITYTEMLQAVADRLSPRAALHSEGVADTAARLAEVYGLDPEPARAAGLLHDWAREMSAEELDAFAGDAGFEVDPVDRAVPYLLHARVGAELVRNRFPALDDAVVRAVEQHTVGGSNMSSLDKVVYVADMIEPGRDFAGVDELRARVGVDSLDELFRVAYARSLARLVELRKRIHPRTVEAWNDLIAGGAS